MSVNYNWSFEGHLNGHLAFGENEIDTPGLNFSFGWQTDSFS